MLDYFCLSCVRPCGCMGVGMGRETALCHRLFYNPRKPALNKRNWVGVRVLIRLGTFFLLLS